MKKFILIASMLLTNALIGATMANTANGLNDIQVKRSSSNPDFSSDFAMDSQSCRMVRGKDAPFILVLKKGENINDALIQCANDAQFPSATISVLGAIQGPTLRYFDSDAKKYMDKKFDKTFEVISMPGNITKLDGKYFAHIHTTLSDANYQVIGGHLKDATVGATIEVSITPMKQNLFRTMNEEVGLNIIRTKNNG